MSLSAPRMRRAVVMSVWDGGGYHVVSEVYISRTQTHVILAQVDALAAHGEGHIDAVVDQQGHVVLGRDLVESPGRGDEGARVAGLVAVLDDGDAAPEGLLDDIGEVPAAEEGGRRIGHEVETVVGLLRGGGGRRCHDGDVEIRDGRCFLGGKSHSVISIYVDIDVHKQANFILTADW